MSERTRRQVALTSSPAAWAWWVAGFERGVQSGYAEGYADALRVFDDAGAALAQLRPSLGIDAALARARRAEMTRTDGVDSEDQAERLAERRRRVAESWGLSAESGAA